MKEIKHKHKWVKANGKGTTSDGGVVSEFCKTCNVVSVAYPKPLKRIKKECKCIRTCVTTLYDRKTRCYCKHGMMFLEDVPPHKPSPKPTKIEKLIEEIEIRGITITMEDISYFPCIESGTWKRFKKEINNLLSH